jgi:hypothetical protein
MGAIGAHVSPLNNEFEAIRDGEIIYVNGTPAFDARVSATLGVKISGRGPRAPTDVRSPRVGSFTNPHSEVSLTSRPLRRNRVPKHVPNSAILR